MHFNAIVLMGNCLLHRQIQNRSSKINDIVLLCNVTDITSVLEEPAPVVSG
jgi:hypothetical protein